MLFFSNNQYRSRRKRRATLETGQNSFILKIHAKVALCMRKDVWSYSKTLVSPSAVKFSCEVVELAGAKDIGMNESFRKF